MNLDLSIIIVNYNTAKLTIDCLNSIKDSDVGKYKIEIILIDNGSQIEEINDLEKYLKKFPLKNIFIKNKTNLGFGVANNIGIKKSEGKYILLLNSDTLVQKDTIANQIKFMQDNKQFSASTCKIILLNKKLDPACHRGFPTPWASFTYFSRLEKLFPKSQIFSKYHQGWKDLSQAHQVYVISGCFFFLDKKVFDKVDLFDETFFMYGEDIDLCLRLKNKGFKIGFNPATKITHLKGMSGKRTSPHFWDAMKIFYTKHYEDKYPKILNNLIYKVLDYKKRLSS